MSTSDFAFRLHLILMGLTQLSKTLCKLSLVQNESLESLVVNVGEHLLEKIDHFELQEVIPWVLLHQGHDVREDLRCHQCCENWLFLQLNHFGYQLDCIQSLGTKWHKISVTYRESSFIASVVSSQDFLNDWNLILENIDKDVGLNAG